MLFIVVVLCLFTIAFAISFLFGNSIYNLSQKIKNYFNEDYEEENNNDENE